MPTLIARGSITITKMDDVYEIKLAPWTVSIPTNADGSNPVLLSAKTRLVVNKDNVVISTTITSLVTKSCTATFSGNEVTLTSVSADSGEVEINFNVEDQQRIAVFTWTKAKQGNAGTDAYTVLLNNESHTIPADFAGIVTPTELDKASTGISAWRGDLPLTAIAANANPGVGQYRYNIANAEGCTAIRIDNQSFKLSSITADSAKVSVNIILEGLQTVVKVMTITKAKSGNNGQRGPSLVPRGLYSPAKIYSGTLTNIDIVKFDDVWYKARTDAGSFSGIAPTGHALSSVKWETFEGDFESIATAVFFAEDSTIENLIATKFRSQAQGARIEIIGNVQRSYNEDGTLAREQKIINGDVVEYWYDKQGNVVTRLSNQGIESMIEEYTFNGASETSSSEAEGFAMAFGPIITMKRNKASTPPKWSHLNGTVSTYRFFATGQQYGPYAGIAMTLEITANGDEVHFWKQAQ